MTVLNTLKDRASSMTWWVLLLEGIAALIIAALMLIAMRRPLELLIQVVGLYLIVRGILMLVGLFKDRYAWFSKIVAGIVAIIAGVIIFQHPVWAGLLAPTTASIIVGVLAIGVGLIGMLQTLAGGGWYYAVLGMACILLGLPFLFNPLAGSTLVPIIVGFIFLIVGAVAVLLALSVRKEQTGA